MSQAPRRGSLRRMLRSPLLLAATALACALPATAGADSIVFVENGNVFSAKPDGSAKVQLTDGGQWHSPTQADDGTLAAVQGTGPIVVMTRDGKLLRTIQTPSAKSGDGGTFAPRPVDLSFSPDGSKIAYSYVAGSCPVASTCGVTQRSTFYTRADASPDATPIATYGNQFSVSDPEWVTNDRTVVFGGAGHHVNFDTLDSGADYNYEHWFDASADTGDGEISRDGRHLVTTYDYGDDTRIVFWAITTGDPRAATPAQPAAYACRTGDADPRFADPSFSPDGLAVAYGSSAGIQEVTFSRLDANPSEGGAGCAVVADEHVVLPGATEPDWGPADPPAARYAPPPAPAPTATPTSTPTSPAPRPKPTLTLTAAGAATQRFTTGRLTITCRASATTTCRATATVKLGRRVYTSKTATGRTPATLRLTFTKAATKAIRKALKHGTVKATVTLRAGTSAHAGRTLRLKG